MKMIVEKLLDEDADIKEKYRGWTPLMKAAEEDLVDIMKLLLDGNADMNATNRKGRTALSFAAAPSMKRRTACRTLKLLLESGAEDTEDHQGLTAKARARKEKRLDALEIFRHFENS